MKMMISDFNKLHRAAYSVRLDMDFARKGIVGA